jgi:hypothetical protein
MDQQPHGSAAISSDTVAISSDISSDMAISSDQRRYGSVAIWIS